MMKQLLCAVLIIALNSAMDVPAQDANLPGLAQIKQRAENGDANAQTKLAQAYEKRFDYSSAATWYRRAAEQGDADAQCSLALFLMKGRPAIAKGSSPVPKEPDEAIKWLLKAAHHGHQGAQIELGTCYRDGNIVKQDYIEAYKWFSLAVSRSGFVDNLTAKTNRDVLILKMATAEIAEGQRRADKFLPNRGDSVELAERAFLSRLKLNGVSGTGDRRVALINNRAFLAGEESEIKIDGKAIQVRCLEVRKDSALIQIDGAAKPKELFLHGAH
jgi:tetratricopeptide (TPR) repeat protein